MSELGVRAFRDSDRGAVVALWREAFANDPSWNDPDAMIRRKLTVQPELFLVGEIAGELCAAVMAGFDGVRGWIHHLAVARRFRRRSVATQMMAAAEAALGRLGCPKVNLQIRSSNADLIAFYQSLGYGVEERVSMGKRLR